MPILIGSVVGVIVLAIAGFFLFGGRGSTPTTGGDPGQSTAPIEEPATAAEAVKGYFDAVARGDAAAALAFAETAPTETSLLSDEVLKAALAETPLTGIEVTEDDNAGSTWATIAVSYSLGERKVSDTIEVSKQGDLWRIYRIAAELDLSSLYTEQVPVLVNGVQATSSKVSVFPGTYTLTTSNENFSVSDGTFVVDSPNSYPSTYEAKIALSKSGTSAVAEAAQSRLASCLKKKEKAPKSCGFSVSNPSGAKLKDSTIKWSSSEAKRKIKAAEWRSDYDDPTTFTSSVFIKVSVKANSTDGRRWTGYSYISKLVADVSSDTPTVTFEG